MRVHFTCLLLIAWLTFQGISHSPSLNVLSGSLHLLFALGVLASFLLHEFAHMGVASWFGVRTRDVVLYPFGGIMALDRVPPPRTALIIALSGPALSLLTALLLSPWVTLRPEIFSFESSAPVERLFAVNLGLAVVNLLPALPLDGGVALRSFLHLTRLPGATRVASRTALVLWISLGLIGLMVSDIIPVIIAAVILARSVGELLEVRGLETTANHEISLLVNPLDKLLSFDHGMSLQQASLLAVRSAQPYFPVMYGGELLGLIERQTLLKASTRHGPEGDEGPNSYISSVMERDFLKVQRDETVESIVKRLPSSSSQPVVVFDGEQFIGLVFPESLVEYLLLHANWDSSEEIHEASV